MPRSPTTSAFITAGRCGFTGCGRARRARAGFTLVELAFTVSILVLLLAVLMPSLASIVRKSHDHLCQTSLRRAAFDFTVFAQEHGTRHKATGERGFLLTDFMAAEYRVMEYWGHAEDGPARAPMSDVFGCARVEAVATFDPGATCITKAVGPGASVSYAFNARLVRAELGGNRGFSTVAEVRLAPSIVSAGRVPLVWDADGGAAERAGKSAHFGAPPISPAGLYGDGSRWFPARRHSGTMQVGFVDGSVGISRDPLRENSAQWGFQTVK